MKKPLIIKDVIILGEWNFNRILNQKKYEYSVKLQKQNGLELPTWKQINEKQWNFKYLNFSLNYIEICVVTKHHGNFILKIPAGTFTDFGSVPNMLKSLIDDNDLRIIVASYFHDQMFACWKKWKADELSYLNFKLTNAVFKAMIKYHKGSNWFAWWCWFGVSSFVGRRRWKAKRPDWLKKGVELEVING